MKLRTRRAVSDGVLATKDIKLKRWPGRLGNNYGTVKVPDAENLVYVRVAGKGTVRAFNNVSDYQYGRAVIVGYSKEDPDKLQVLSVRTSQSGGIGGGSGTQFAPASRYRWMDLAGGEDPVYIELRQFMPLRPGMGGGMNLQISRGIVRTSTGFALFPTQNVDLTSYIPTTSGKAALVLVTIDDSATIICTKSSEEDIVDIPNLAIPTPPTGTIRVLAAVRVYVDQTDILEARTNTDLVDLRFADYVISGGSGASAFTDLSDAFASYSGLGGEYVKVKATEDGLETGTPLQPDLASASPILVTDFALATGTEYTWPNSITFRGDAIISRLINGVTYQLTAYWNDDQYLAFAKRIVPSTTWETYITTITPSIVDEHNSISLGIDPDNIIHVSYDNHITPLNYRKSTQALDEFTGSLTGLLEMISGQENEATYPTFFNDPAGKLYFMFRDAIGCDANDYFYIYDEDTSTWGRAAGTYSVAGNAGLLINGKISDDGPYFWHPVFDDDFGSGGFMHLMWTWRGDCVNAESNYDLYYVRWDGTDWTDITGAAQTVPITVANGYKAIDIGPNSGLINQGFIDVDGNGHPHIAYLATGADTYWHHYHAYYNGSTWVIKQLTTSPIPPWDFYGNRADIVIDRDINQAYIILVDKYDTNGVQVWESGIDDFTVWTKYLAYTTDVGKYEPTHDFYRWKTSKLIDIPVAEWFPSGTTFTIKLLEIRTPHSTPDAEIYIPANDNNSIEVQTDLPPLGTNLTKYGIVLAKGAGGTWDNTLVESPAIWFDHTQKKYGMVYTGYNGTTEAIGLAWSDDLLTWTKSGGAAVFSPTGTGGTPDQGGVTGALIWQENGTYYLFYIGLTSAGYEQGTPSLCLATSTDLSTWTRHGAIISPSGSGWRSTRVFHPSIVKVGDTYYLFFNANGSYESIGYASSTDLLTWLVDDTNSPVLDIGLGWDNDQIGDPSVYHIGGLWWMAYYGAFGSPTGARDGLAFTAEKDFPLGWTKFYKNPVLIPSESYDAKYAHKPFIVLTPGRYYHFYTAVDGSTPEVRQIALAIEGSNTHHATHENGGNDEISVAGLSGLLADPQTPASHVHAASDITSGTMDQARLGTGSGGGGTKFLADDQTYKTPSVASGRYRQWLYSASGGDLTILTDVDGNPLTGLCDLEV